MNAHSYKSHFNCEDNSPQGCSSLKDYYCDFYMCKISILELKFRGDFDHLQAVMIIYIRLVFKLRIKISAGWVLISRREILFSIRLIFIAELNIHDFGPHSDCGEWVFIYLLFQSRS